VTVSQAIAHDAGSPETFKFVEIEVVKVVNPMRHPVRFEVFYEVGDAKELLGTFSLFPADNPGKFIVPTQGKLKSEGKLILSFILPEDAAKDDELRIDVKALKLKEN
jgi:hypothetical protein